MVLLQLRTHHPPQNASLVPLFREARALADDVEVSIWGHHYRAYKKMAYRLANIAMDTTDSIQVDSSTEHTVVLEATAFIDNDVNHWLEASQAEHHELQGPALNPRNLILSWRDSARRRSAVRGLVLPSI